MPFRGISVLGDGNRGGVFHGIAVHTAANGRTGQRLDIVLRRETERAAIAAGQQLRFVVTSPTPHRAHGVYHVLGGEPIGRSELGISSRASAEGTTRGQQPGPAARWIAPSTPPPPSRVVFAALTTASTLSVVMSWVDITIRTAIGDSSVLSP